MAEAGYYPFGLAGLGFAACFREVPMGTTQIQILEREMTLKTTKLRDAIVCALVVGATGFAGTALAQQTQPAQTPPTRTATDLDTIVVTGTRIQSQTVTAASPVTEVAQEEFQFSGTTRTEDLVNQYPQMSPSFDSFNNNPSLGYPTVNLGPWRGGP